MILLYHSVLPNNCPSIRIRANYGIYQSTFHKQALWLRKNRVVVPLDQYISELNNPIFQQLNPIAITFDDGFRETFDCILPIIQEMQLPITIFTSSGHLENGELLWFSYLKALCFESNYEFINEKTEKFFLGTIHQRQKAWKYVRSIAINTGDLIGFIKGLSHKYPLTSELASHYSGLTLKQLEIAVRGNLIEFGGHTVHHPLLDQLPIEIQQREIFENKNTLSELIGKPIRFFAYPGGEYNQDTVALVKKSGYDAAFAIIPKRFNEPLFEIERVGIYSQSIHKFIIKMRGIVKVLRRIGIKIG